MHIATKKIMCLLLIILFIPFTLPAFAADIVKDNFTSTANPSYVYQTGNIDGQNGWSITSSSAGTGSSVTVITENSSTVGQGNTMKLTTGSGTSSYGPQKSFTPQTTGTYFKLKVFPTSANYTILMRFLDSNGIQMGQFTLNGINGSLVAYYVDNAGNNNINFSNSTAERSAKINQWNTIEAKFDYGTSSFSNLSYYLNGTKLNPAAGSSTIKSGIANLSTIKIAQSPNTTNYFDDFTLSSGPLNTPTGVVWGEANSQSVSWTGVEDAKSYIGYLYRDAVLVHTYPSILGTSQDCGEQMGIYGAGLYTFSVSASNTDFFENSPESAQSAGKRFYDVTYDANGGTGAQKDNHVYCANDTATVLGRGTVEKGGLTYIFNGWNTKADGTGVDYAENSQITMGSSNVRLYAKWVINPAATEVALQLIHDLPWGNLYDVLKTYDEALGIDIRKIDALTYAQKAVALKMLSDKQYSKQGFLVAYNNACQEAAKPPQREATEGDGKRGYIRISPTVAPNSSGIDTFTDLSGVPWAQAAIEELAVKGILSGYPDNSFKPNDNITREEFVKMLVMAFDLYNENSSSEFADISTNDWFYPYISSAVQKGLISGKNSGRFGVGENMTREEMAVLVYRFAKDAGKQFQTGNSIFIDNDAIKPWAKEAVAELGSAGLIKGLADGSFMPDALATRAQAAKVLYDVLSYQ